jgi:menaquinone-dependent protoporphyrinogen oxidase
MKCNKAFHQIAHQYHSRGEEMKTLIVYATSHGCTEGCASKIKSMLPGETDLVNLKKDTVPDIASYDAIVIGGSIHAGRVQSAVRKFCGKNESALSAKKLGLFLCCMETGEKAQQQFESAFSETLRLKAIAQGIFGGEFRFENMKRFEQWITKKVAHIDGNVSTVDEAKIREFAEKIQAAG